MSRCFPYPPPGYSLSRASQEALIDSIKLQKEREKTEEQRQKRKEEEEQRQNRKEKKKEKKEKKKEKKEKKKEKKEKKDSTHQTLCKSDTVQAPIGDKRSTDAKGEFLHKGCKTEPEQLERSSLTEEHGLPISLHVPTSSSDSTENSNKRKRLSSPEDANNGRGKIIRIRLSSKKQDPSSTEQQVCSTSGRTLVPSQSKDEIGLRQRSVESCSTSGGDVGMSDTVKAAAPRVNREQASHKIETVAPRKNIIPSMPGPVKTAGPRFNREQTSHKIETVAAPRINREQTSYKIETVVAPRINREQTSHKTETIAAPGINRAQTSHKIETVARKTAIPSVLAPVLTPMQRLELQYKNLFERWVPPQLSDMSLDVDDSDWLFQGKKQERRDDKKSISGNESILCSSSSTSWPRAQMLPEVDVYALPFTIPF